MKLKHVIIPGSHDAGTNKMSTKYMNNDKMNGW